MFVIVIAIIIGLTFSGPRYPNRDVYVYIYISVIAIINELSHRVQRQSNGEVCVNPLILKNSS